MDKDLKYIFKMLLQLAVSFPILLVSDFTWKHFAHTPKRRARRVLLYTWLRETNDGIEAATERLDLKDLESKKE